MSVLPVPKPVAYQELSLVEKAETMNRLYALAMIVMLVALAFMVYESAHLSSTLAHRRPWIVRVDDLGRAEPIRLSEQQFIPNDRELKYFITRFVDLYFTRDHVTVAKQYPLSGYFLSPQKFAEQSSADAKSRWLEKFLSSGEDNQEINISKVVIEPQGSERYLALVEFEKVFVAVGGSETKRKRYTATIHFGLDPTRVTTELIPYNPLGFFIDYIKTDEAFN